MIKKASTNLIFLFFLAAGGLMAGCASYNRTIFTPSVKSAQQDFNNQNYESAVAKYQQLALTHPDEKKRQFFVMQKGRALYLMRSFHDAEATFRDYLRNHPDGLYLDESESYLTKIQSLRAEKDRKDYLKREQIEGDIRLLRRVIENDPYNAQAQYQLASKLWDIEEYDEAARHYLRAGEIDAALKESELIKNRLMIDESGDAVPITPERQKLMEQEKNPLVTFDVHSYEQRVKPEVMGASKALSTVAGKVRNQSGRVLRHASVNVNFYNVRHDILDTQVYYIGTMGPREVRAFLVNGQNFDNIHNVDHFECHTYFQ